MSSVICGLAASLFYLASLAAQLFALHEGAAQQRARRLAGWLAVPALALHLLSVAPAVFTAAGMQFSLYNAASVFFLAAAFLAWAASFRWPLSNLLLVLYPLTVVAVLCALFLPAPVAPRTAFGWGIAAHILLSILAYSILSIAAVQAAALALLISRLKHRRLHGLVDLMPSLATMESLLFRLIWTGEVLLAAAMLTGALFLEDIMAQHLAHKTVLSAIAWLVFAVLLWGRHFVGWRGLTAIRWTLSGFGLLILAYFGSKFVLQVVLHH